MKTQTRLVEPKASKNSTLSADPQASSKPLGAWAQRLDATAWFQAPRVTRRSSADPSGPPSWGHTCPPHTPSPTLTNSPGPALCRGPTSHHWGLRQQLPPGPALESPISPCWPEEGRTAEVCVPRPWTALRGSGSALPGWSGGFKGWTFPKPAQEASWETLAPQHCTLCLSWSLPHGRLRWILSSLFWKGIYLLTGFPNIMSSQVAQDSLTNKRHSWGQECYPASLGGASKPPTRPSCLLGRKKKLCHKISQHPSPCTPSLIAVRDQPPSLFPIWPGTAGS